MATVEQRLAAVEQQVQELRHLAETGAPAAAAFGLAFVRDEVHELRRETKAGFADLRGEIAAVRSEVESLNRGTASRLDRIEQLLQTLLERG